LPFGTYTVIETAPAPGYMTATESNQPKYKTITLAATSAATRHQTVSFVNWLYRVQPLLKTDSGVTTQTVAGAEFTLYKAQSVVGTSTPTWVEIQKLETDADGKIDFQKLVFGDYKIVETRPNPNYATPEESGKDIEHFFTVDATTKGNHLLQVLSLTNDQIRISCEVDKHTIDRTSAAYIALPGEEGTNNTATGTEEEYRYDVDFRSTSNFRADEFVVDDPLEGVAKDQIRVKELWTPIVYGDSDGHFNLWYKTNKTDDATNYSTVSAMSTNPVNANNPTNKQNWPNTGFKLWSEDVTSTAREHFKVADLHLAPGEYITALRLEYGSVEKGFTSCNTTTKGGKDWAPEQSRQDYAQGAADATGLEPLTYMVYCPGPLPVSTEETVTVPVKLPGGSTETTQSVVTTDTVIYNSVTARIARNVILTDEDEAKVETRVIGTFTLAAEHPTPTGYDKLSSLPTPVGGMANTGDTTDLSSWVILFLIALFAAGVAHRPRSVTEYIGTINGKLEKWRGFSRPDNHVSKKKPREKRAWKQK